MCTRLERPVFTRLFEGIEQVPFEPDSLLIRGDSVEDRSRYPTGWDADTTGVTVLDIVEENPSAIVANIEGNRIKAQLRSEREILDLLRTRPVDMRYLDITGLPHHVWAPILRGIRTLGTPCSVLYAEPVDYRRSLTPTEATIFDLSERIRGIAPIPGFASLARAGDDDALFVPLLGFEGARLAFVLEAVQPKNDSICPIVGVPGFRAEYPFYTYLGNGVPLKESGAWSNVRYARANCPFSVYQVLSEVSNHWPGRKIVIAPIGTKPHALGAVLYCLDHPDTTELVYDHPVRKATRTAGTWTICVYDLGLLSPVRRQNQAAATAYS
ncbi:MAG: hypothetical protein JXA57_04985 [Armatimonadetes bacterium]|nr:hypothetical protein [Armatimonadota bacterium]